MTEPLLTNISAAENDGDYDPEPLLDRLEDCWDESVRCEHTLREARDALQGAWVSVGGRREVELFICGNRFTVHFRDGDVYMGAFDLDPTIRPAVMAMRIDEGPTRHRGQTAMCIYELEGRTLRWCATDPGRGERLTAFPDESDPNHLCVRFRRQYGRSNGDLT
jgi:uncharacterized protein (TIGR03067 family)